MVANFDKIALVDRFRPIYPSPAGLVSSADEAGRPNLVTLGEIFNVSIASPVIVGIAIRPATYSHSLITRTGEFVVNLPTVELVEKVAQVGSVSGRNGLDKFALTGLTPLPATIVKPPLVGECPVNLECRVVAVTAVGDHDLVLGEVVAQHVDADVLDESGSIVPARLHGFSMFLGEFWSMGVRVWKHY